MAHFPKKASLEDIPSEIRLNIYSYLLSDQNVIVLKGGILCPKYTKALFTLNKNISTESLAYFCAENGFVTIGTNLGSFLSTCAFQLPLILGDNVRQFSHSVLSAEIITDRAAPYIGELGRLCFAIIASRHLSNFVRLLNTEHCEMYIRGRTTTVHLLYRTKDNLFTPKRSAIACAIGGIKGIRNIEGLRTRGRLGITIEGDLDMQTAEEIIASTDPPAPTFAEILDHAVQAKERGDDFFQACDYNAARTEYIISLRTVYTAGERHYGFLPEPIWQSRYRFLLVSLYTVTSLLNSKQGEYESAVAQADMAMSMGMGPPGEIGASPARKAELVYRVGCTLVDAGRDDQAAKRFREALSYVPDDVQIKTKLEETTARWDARMEAAARASARK
ncbi:hypothetical protein MMC17_004835 [Xylographa soralifera]|nr:hypothetical protein [Xylographa soralifera]